jgi:hypothetical protein
MSMPTITRQQFLENRLGRTFADVVNDPDAPFDEVLAFFSDKDRQRRMEESELHHDRPPLAGVIREFESRERIHRFLATAHPRQSQRLRQAVGVIVRILMERLGWSKTGRKGSLGVRTAVAPNSTVPGSHYNTGGLALWFLRAERYERHDGMPYGSVRRRCAQLEQSQQPGKGSDPSGTARQASQRKRRGKRNGVPVSKKSKP